MIKIRLKFLFATAIVANMTALGVLSLSAQSIPPSVQSRIVPAGVKRQLGFFTSINANCTSAGEVIARIVTPPKYGSAEIDQGPGYPNFEIGNQRYQCNGKLVEGYRVNYTSQNAFEGQDTVEVEFFTPNGQQVIWKYTISVK